MVDRPTGEVLLRQSWRPLSHRLAVAGGSLVALLSLLHHVPVATASLRGGAAYCSLLLASRLGWAAMQWAMELDRRQEAHDRNHDA